MTQGPTRGCQGHRGGGRRDTRLGNAGWLRKDDIGPGSGPKAKGTVELVKVRGSTTVFSTRREGRTLGKLHSLKKFPKKPHFLQTATSILPLSHASPRLSRPPGGCVFAHDGFAMPLPFGVTSHQTLRFCLKNRLR